MQIETARPAESRVEGLVVVRRGKEDTSLLRPNAIERVKQPAERDPRCDGVAVVLLLLRLTLALLTFLVLLLWVDDVALDAFVERRIDVLHEYDTLVGELGDDGVERGVVHAHAREGEDVDVQIEFTGNAMDK